MYLDQIKKRSPSISDQNIQIINEICEVHGEKLSEKEKLENLKSTFSPKSVLH